MKLEKFVNINWYMERKPYAVHADYDVFYLKICRRLFSIIDALVVEYENALDLDEEDRREMAYVFTAYFEDRVNDIGFWESLVQLHKKQFGKRLPFSDKQFLQEEEEELEDILPADIHYLAYISYLNLVSDADEKVLVYFDKEFFLELTERVFEYLSGIEEVLTSDFYQHYLLPNDDYIDLKNKLDWFTFNGYLTGIEFSKKLDDHLWRLMDGETEESFISPLMYAERDRLMFEVASSLTAFFPVDIFAGATNCSEEKKKEMVQLKTRPHGIFHVQQETPVHYHFLHTSTNEEFTVVKKSFNQPFDSKQEEYWIATLAGWNNEYYISGLCMPSPYSGEEIHHQNLKNQHSYQKHFPSYRKHIEQTALDYRNEAAKFFGTDLVVFATGYEAEKRFNEFGSWYFDTVTDKSRLAKNSKPVVFKLPKELLTVSEIALFIPPADGIQFITKHNQLLHLLQRKDPDKISPDEIQEILPMFWDNNVGAEYWFYLRQNFTLPNLSLFLKCPLTAEEDFDAILRIYRPEDFSPLRLPRFSTFNSEHISQKTVKKIFSRKK